MATIRVDRVMAASPASVALLLAGPDYQWPGVTRVDGPRRRRASYRARFRISGADAVVTVSYAGGATSASVTLRGRAGAGARSAAAFFLARIAAAAEERSLAA